jgi:ketosteroid isomerase-like protein
MMRRILVVTIVIALCLAHCTRAKADDNADITALYTKMSAAMKAKNAAAIMAMVTPDFKRMKINGMELNAKEAEKDLRARYANTKTVSDATIKPDSIRITGTKAMVWTSYTTRSEVVDKEGTYGAKGQKHQFADKGQTRDWLIKTPKGWKFYLSEAKMEAPTMDGQSTRRMGPSPRR